MSMGRTREGSKREVGVGEGKEKNMYRPQIKYKRKKNERGKTLPPKENHL